MGYSVSESPVGPPSEETSDWALINVMAGGGLEDVSDLNWEASFAVARALQARFPDIELEAVSLDMIYEWALNLPGFDDDPELANDSILLAIYQEWFEERNPV